MTYARQQARMEVDHSTYTVKCACGENFAAEPDVGREEALNMVKIGDTWRPLCPACLCVGALWDINEEDDGI